MSTIDPNRQRDAENLTRRRLLEEKRARDLDEVESAFNSQVKQSAERRGEEIRRVRENESEAIRNAEADADHKVTLASQAADNQIRNFKNQTYNLTQDASKNFQEKARYLEQATRSMDEERNHLTAAHADAMKKLQEENQARRSEIKNKYGSESNVAMMQANHTLKAQSKAEADALNQLQQSYRQKKELLETEGKIQYMKLADNNKRLQEELTQQSSLMEGSERDKQNKIQEDSARRYNLTLAKSQAQMEALRAKERQALHELTQKSEADLHKLQYHLAQEEGRELKTNQDKIQKSKEMTFKEVQHLENTLESQRKLLERDHFKKISDLRKNNESTQDLYTQQSQGVKEKANKDYLAQNRDLRQKHDASLDQTRQLLAKDIATLNDHALNQIESAKLETSQKVSDIYTKSSDPFYRLRQLEVKVEDTPEALILKVPVPEYEKDSVKVTANKNSITVTGTRRFESKAEVLPGHSASTHSYQSFSETFNTQAALDLSKLEREYAQGVLKFTLPKRGFGPA